MGIGVLKLRKTHKGTCSFCGKEASIERHHVSYRPERTLQLCHDCHFKVHFFPQRLTEFEIKQLIICRYKGAKLQEIFKTQHSLNNTCADIKRSLTLSAIHNEKIQETLRAIAPSRKVEMANVTKK